MESYDKRDIYMTSIVVLGAVLIIWAFVWGATIKDREAMKYGYDVQRIPSQQETQNYIKKENK